MRSRLGIPGAEDLAAEALGAILANPAVTYTGPAGPTLSGEPGSRHTSTDYFVEVAFTTRDDAVRFVAEPKPWSCDGGSRLGVASELLREVLGQSVPEAFLREMRALQDGAELAQGALVGVRTTPSSQRFKLYAEIPRGRAREADRLADSHAAIPTFVRYLPGVRPCLFAVELWSHQREHYWAVPALSRRALIFLLERVEEWMAGYARRPLPAIPLGRARQFGLGVSVVTDRQEVVEVSIHLRFAELFDERLDELDSWCAEALACRPAVARRYSTMMRPLPAQRREQGLLSVNFPREGACSLTVGFPLHPR